MNQPPPTGAPFGLRQRRDINRNESDENANPQMKEASRDDRKPKVRAPPRLFLSTTGKSALRSAGVPAASNVSKAASADHKSASSQALTVVKNDESSLWVVAYGFRTQAHFNALLRRLESCGNITSSRGSNRDRSNAWVAVRYSSALSAHKALCQNGSFVSVGGQTMVIGVLSFTDSDAAARLGIDIYGESDDLGIHSLMNTGVHEQPIVDDSEVLLTNGEDDTEVEGDRSSLDGVCGKVLAWFFNW